MMIEKPFEIDLTNVVCVNKKLMTGSDKDFFSVIEGINNLALEIYCEEKFHSLRWLNVGEIRGIYNFRSKLMEMPYLFTFHFDVRIIEAIITIHVSYERKPENEDS